MSVDPAENRPCFRSCFNALLTWFQITGYYPRSLSSLVSSNSQTFPCTFILYFVSKEWPICIILHFTGLNPNFHLSDHDIKLLRSTCKTSPSFNVEIRVQTLVSSADILPLLLIHSGISNISTHPIQNPGVHHLIHVPNLGHVCSIWHRRSPPASQNPGTPFLCQWLSTRLVQFLPLRSNPNSPRQWLHLQDCYLSCSMPEGSSLGPKTFITYTEDVDSIFSAHHVQHHSYADDIQGHVATLPHQASTTAPRLQHCIADVADWGSSKRLQLNELKTELTWFGSSAALNSLSQSDMTINSKEDVIRPVSTVHDLGMYLDSELSMRAHISKITRTCFFHLRRLRQVRSAHRTAVHDHCTTIAHHQCCRETRVRLTFTRPCLSRHDRATLAASRSLHTIQVMPACSSDSHRQSSDIHNGSSAAHTDTLVSLYSLAFGHKVGLPGTEIAPEVWRARLQRGRSQGLEQLATACPSSREHWHLQAETKNFFIL